MIKTIKIKNLAILKDLNIDFQPGLTAITGETGSGKSIILKAIGIGIGMKADKMMIRNGEREATIGLKFGNSKIERIISREGPTKTYLDNKKIKINDLLKVCSDKFEFHGQNDQQYILDRNNHIEYLDKYCGHQHEVEELNKIYFSINKLKKDLDGLKDKSKKKNERLDFLKFQINEIESLNPTHDEYIELNNQFKKMSNIEEITRVFSESYNKLHNDSNSVTEQLDTVYNDICSIIKFDRTVKSIATVLKECMIQIDDMKSELSNKLTNDDYNSEEIKHVNDRIKAYEMLKRKYGGSIESVLENFNDIKNELCQINTLDDSILKINNEIEKKENAYRELSLSLHNRRMKVSKKLEKVIENAIRHLNMPSATFRIEITQEELKHSFLIVNNKPVNIYPTGFDLVEFHLSANPGEPAKPMVSTASGGEISRVLLAVKTVFQNIDPVNTMIFDEIDTGISGRAAEKVAEHLLSLSKKKQVICITHLSQIAFAANNHMHVTKFSDGKETFVNVDYLSRNRSNEVVRELFLGNKLY